MDSEFKVHSINDANPLRDLVFVNGNKETKNIFDEVKIFLSSPGEP